MILGIEAAAAITAFESAGAGLSTAVTFNSARLVLPSVSCTDNADFSFSGWFNAQWGGPSYVVAFVSDPENNYATNLQGFNDAGGIIFQASNASTYTGANVTESPITSGQWQHIIGTIQTSPSRIVKIYLDDVDSGTASLFGSTFTPITTNGRPFWIGSDSAGSDFYVGSMCDLSIWPGVSFLTAGDIAEATRRLFIDAEGKRVDPSVAVASLGSPAIMLTGDTSTFLLNSLGTSGSLTLAEGSLSSAVGPA